MKYNTNVQTYKSIKIRLIKYTDSHFARLRAKRFLIITEHDTGHVNQNFWIPNCYLEPDGTIKKGANLDWAFRKAHRAHKLEYAGIEIPGWI